MYLHKEFKLEPCNSMTMKSTVCFAITHYEKYYYLKIKKMVFSSVIKDRDFLKSDICSCES